jgi:hypothetical protein
VAGVTLPGTFAVGTSSVGFWHDLNPPYELLLALGAEKSAAIPLPDSLKGNSATQTGFAFPPKHFQVILIPSGLPFKVNKIGKTGSLMSDCPPQYSTNRANQSKDLPGIQIKATPLWMDPGQKQCFACINIAQAGNFLLVEKERLHLLPAVLKNRLKP